MHHRFFSIIVPAYNEGKLIGKTLDHLTTLNYPRERFEIIVVENRSTDDTLSVAKKYESENCHIYQSAKGVSRARNFGISKCAARMEWGILLDADTTLKKNILNEINAYLETHPRAGFGTTSVFLDDETLRGRFWSHYINVTDRLIKIMHRIHIVRRDLLYKIAYDEELVSGEDLKYSRDLARHGKYFFMDSDQVITSARRFLKKGYLAIFFINMKSALPKGILKRADWETIR